MALIDDWVAKAEADWKGAGDLSRRRRDPLPELVCFLCQQCTEKYLKAFLLLHGQKPPRVHDLVQLLKLASLHDPSLVRFLAAATPLNAYAVQIRYPGLAASPSDAQRARSVAGRLRRALRRRIRP